MLTTQAREASENPRSARIDGNATFTIVPSRTIIKSPRHSTSSASHRLRSVVTVAPFVADSGESRSRWDDGG